VTGARWGRPDDTVGLTSLGSIRSARPAWFGPAIEGELVGEILGIASAEALGLDSWIMVGADGLGSKEGVRVFSLTVLA